MLHDLVGDGEAVVGHPEVPLGARHLFGPERGAVGRGGILLGGSAEADIGVRQDQRWPGIHHARRQCRIQLAQVVAVCHALHVPAVRFKPRAHVLGEGEVSRPVNRYPVGVVQVDQLAELQVASQGGGLRRDPLHEVAIGDDSQDAVIDHRELRPVEAVGEVPLGHRHPHPGREALAQGPGGGLDARGVTVFRVPRRPGPPLAEALQLLERQVVPGQVEH